MPSASSLSSTGPFLASCFGKEGVLDGGADSDESFCLLIFLLVEHVQYVARCPLPYWFLWKVKHLP